MSDAAATTAAFRAAAATRVRLDPDGQIAELWLFIRPMAGLARFAAAVGSRLGRRRDPVRGALVTLIAGPLPVLTRAGDWLAVRTVGMPRR